MAYHINELILPFKADRENAEEYIEKFDFVGFVLDQKDNKRYYLKTEANPDDVRLELDDTQSVSSIPEL